ncbi:hypothetical protein BO83DRAFT_399123 [Aspergillus eucalypticola CBS 122712]|uniref:Trichothecene 3-O-acetyltransferase-like N-terminal domain-containing protein n=1 Tax=Aspergillus eucalypticola (strain CBS 122712 / IBT 29274) TaxID=1448314 RepID=A0A317VLJ2_ASPEC|nr:uncharacterized protein BO83DRAFT_399123 [Aspergillus eucalypticola CBS 122712]PWY72760.1 hypothetical protein BO83DRAFT_399123 [Aspergillus eucalypticola CBS 122712]
MDDCLDIFGQQTFTINIQSCFCFPLQDNSACPKNIDTLTKGLERLSTSFPWLAGQVVNEGSGDGDTDNQDESAPVFLIRANFITGGLLTFVAQHNVMDATGLTNIIHLFSKACRNEDFTDKERWDGNLSRRDIVPLLEDSHMAGAELNRYMINAMASLAPPSFVSTDDSLTAFIWQSVARARLRRLDSSTHSTLCTGHSRNVYTGFPMKRLIEEPLGTIALQLRFALSDKLRLEHHTRAIATFLSRTPDKSKFSFGASIDTTTDLIPSSWAKLEGCCSDFNLGLGLPEAVRKPRCNEVERLTLLLPKTLESNVVVAICLRDGDVAELRSDVVFHEHAESIG